MSPLTHVSTFALLVLPLACTLGCGADESDSIADRQVTTADPVIAQATTFKTDEFSVNTPEGYAWKFMQKVRNDGVDGAVYVCSQQSSTTAMSLTVEERERSHNEFRNAGVVGHFNGTIESLGETGAKVVRVDKPDLTLPIGARVSFAVECLEPSGDTVYCYGQTVFGKHTYLFQAFSKSASEARKLASFASTFVEKE